MSEDRFILTPKDEASITMTIRIKSALNVQLEALARKSNRSRNEIINLALEFALNNVKFVDNKSDT